MFVGRLRHREGIVVDFNEFIEYTLKLHESVKGRFGALWLNPLIFVVEEYETTYADSWQLEDEWVD